MRAILTFHSIDDRGSVLSFPIKRFRHLVETIGECGVPVLDLDGLMGARRGIALTFDDGMRSVHDHALPVLRDYGFPAHLFLATGLVGSHGRRVTGTGEAARPEMLCWSEVEECARSGVLVESHTQTHPDIRRLSDLELTEECDAADRAIGAVTGRHPRHFAYPYGYHDSRTANLIRNRYLVAVTTRLAYLGGDSADRALVPRLDSYYLGGDWMCRNLFARRVRAYIAFRRWMRVGRHGFE